MSDSPSADAAVPDGPATSRREARLRREAAELAARAERTAEETSAPVAGAGTDHAVADDTGAAGAAVEVNPQATKNEPHGKRRGGALLFLRDVVVIVVIAVLASFLIKSFVVRSFYIPSGSMENTLLVNDRILVDEVTPHWNDYERGEIVVFSDPGGWLPNEPKLARPPVTEGIDWFLTMIGLSAGDSDDHLVKRVIGLPGDHIECCTKLGQITVNGKPVDETGYLKQPEAPASSFPFDITVPDGSLWVMGDNRNNSEDSRAHIDEPGHGFVPIDDVVGRVFFRTWPFDRFGWMSAPEAFRSVPAAGTP